MRSLLPILAFALPAVVAVGARTEMAQRDRAQFEQTARITASQAALRLDDYVGARLLAADTLREAVQTEPALNEPAFRERALHIQDRFGGFLALNWIDPDGVIRWVVPEAPNRAALGRSVLDHPTAGPFFDRSRAGEDVASPPLNLFQGLAGFATYLPIGDGRGTMNAVFHTDRLVEDCFGSGLLDAWELSLDDAGASAYSTEGFADAPPHLGAGATLSVVDRTWSLTVRPGPALSAAQEAPARDAVVALFLLLAIGLGISVRATLLRTEQATEADRKKAEADRQKEEADRKSGLLAEELEEARQLEAIGRLAGGVAHDFNNLLTAIGGSASLLLDDGPQDPESRELLKDIVDASHHGAELTSGLLAFARQQVLRPRSLDTGLELRRAEGLLARLIRADIEWSHRIDDGLWPIEMDAGELNRVVVNLVTNGVDAMPTGGRLRLDAANLRVEPGETSGPEEGEWVRIEVADTGEGMPEEVQGRMFEPFFTTKGLGRGTGLGLASVYGAVRAVGGHVTVASVVDEGTQIALWLPRSELRPEPPLEPSGPVRGVGQKVLLVEDQEALRRVAAKMLQRAGYEVIQASGASEAEAVAEATEHLDVLVTDMVMPGGGGDELAQALLEARPTLAVVYTSGYTSDNFDVGQLLGPHATYLPKPYNRRELAAAVDAVLRGDAGPA